MSDSNRSQSILIISEDLAVAEAIIGSTNGLNILTRNSVQAIMGENGLLNGNGLIILDIDGINGHTEERIDQIISIKRQDPTQVLILFGKKESLNELLKSRVQPLIYRAFNKPVHPNQISLAFTSALKLNAELVERKEAGENLDFVGPAENRASLNTLSEQRKPNKNLFVTLGLLALLALGWFIFNINGEPDNTAPNSAESVEENTPAIPAPSTDDEFDTDAQFDVVQTNKLNQLAEDAILDQRLISPPNDNALEYYDQVLAIDPYDRTAYEGKKIIANTLRDDYAELVSQFKFEQALSLLGTLRLIEPLNVKNDDLAKALEQAIEKYVKQIRASGSSEEIAKTSAVLTRLEADFEGSKSASNALKKELALIKQIDTALSDNNLIPPTPDNAYSIVSDALKNNVISKANSAPRVRSLSTKLIALANIHLENNAIDEASILVPLIARLNVNNEELSALENQLRERQTGTQDAVVEGSQDATLNDQTTISKPKIIPAKLISRSSPRYPTRAVDNNIEGWVTVSFKIDTSGKPFNVAILESSPLGVFDQSAIKSIKRWRFAPARDEKTGLPVEGEVGSTRVTFKLK